MDPWASEKANLIDILTHVSGVASQDYSCKKNDSVSDITRNLRNFRPTFELREQWLYNNQMYMVGAYVVSTLTGMRFTDFVNNRIFKPLGMSSSTYSIDKALQTGEYVDLVAGTAGIISCVEDLSLWLRMVLNGGVDPVSNATIIPSAELEVIIDAHSIVGLGGANALESTDLYGLGWHRDSYLGHDVISHPGDAPGVSTFIACALEDGIGIIALANADSKDTALLNITDAAAAIAFGIGGASSPTANQPTTSRRSKLPRRASLVTRGDDGGALHRYGSGELCSVRSSSPSCKSVLDAFHATDPSLSPNSPDLFGSWVTLLSTHVRFTYTNDSQYLIYIGSIYAEGYGKNTTPFSTLDSSATAEFVVENGKVSGFGWNDLGNGGKRAGSVEETSDVWFAKVA
ncbi:beta-lactamase/transpeptidase-like protein [Russula vinacea]|nr:beta-lactamase/transpeptidase-like protein [Russula vinacea]